MPPRAPLAALAALAACGGPAASEDPDALRPGLYEVTVSFVEATPPLPAEALEAARAAAGLGETERQCFEAEGMRHRVGGSVQDGRCRYTEVEEQGVRVRRVAACDGGRSTITWIGTRAPDRYDLRITVSGSVRPGSEARTVVTRETGRRIGACPEER